jgi:hypothetical protein
LWYWTSPETGQVIVGVFQTKPGPTLEAVGFSYKGIRNNAVNQFGAFLTAEGIKIAKWARFLPL